MWCEVRGATNLSIACPGALELCWVSRSVMVALTRMFSFLSLSARRPERLREVWTRSGPKLF